MERTILFFKSHVSEYTLGNTRIREHYRRAAKFAAAKHKGQTRKDGKTPYITHPIQVATILSKEAHENDPVLILGALLHDTIEDTNTSYEELVQEFGKEVADLVKEVSDDMSRPKMERRKSQEGKSGSDRAARLKIADKTANLRDLVTAPPIGMSKEKKIEYANHARKVIESMREHPEALKRLFDLAYQRVLNH